MDRVFYQGLTGNSIKGGGGNPGRPALCGTGLRRVCCGLVQHRCVEAAHGVLRHGVQDEARHELCVHSLAGLGVDTGHDGIAGVVDLTEFRNRAGVRQLLESGHTGAFVGVGDLLDDLLDAVVDTEIGTVHHGGQVVVLGVAEDVDDFAALEQFAQRLASLFFEFSHSSIGFRRQPASITAGRPGGW